MLGLHDAAAGGVATTVRELQLPLRRSTACPICNGRGMVRAAPVEVVAIWTGSDPEPEHKPRAAWEQSLAVPCWACNFTNLKVMV